MSDIGIDVPLPVAVALIGALYWPVTACVALIAAATGAAAARTWLRVVCFVLAGGLAADCLLAMWLGAG